MGTNKTVVWSALDGRKKVCEKREGNNCRVLQHFYFPPVKFSIRSTLSWMDNSVMELGFGFWQPEPPKKWLSHILPPDNSQPPPLRRALGWHWKNPSQSISQDPPGFRSAHPLEMTRGDAKGYFAHDLCLSEPRWITPEQLFNPHKKNWLWWHDKGHLLTKAP